MCDPRWLDDDEQATWRAYLRSSRLLMAQLERELQRDSGLSLTDYQILVELSEAPERRLRMSDLAASTQSSRSRLSHAISRLEGAGWVTRRSCPTDRRGSFAVLTGQGLAKLEAAAPGHVEGVQAHVFDQFADDQVLGLRRLSEAISDHLEGTDDA